VWFSVAIPRHSFLLWLVFWDALVTKEKMSRWGYEGDYLSFYRGRIENWEHLFFRCSFSAWPDVGEYHERLLGVSSG
jgi:hypothetical protein